MLKLKLKSTWTQRDYMSEGGPSESMEKLMLEDVEIYLSLTIFATFYNTIKFSISLYRFSFVSKLTSNNLSCAHGPKSMGPARRPSSSMRRCSLVSGAGAMTKHVKCRSVSILSGPGTADWPEVAASMWALAKSVVSSRSFPRSSGLSSS